MKVNFTPVNTVQSYGINNIEILDSNIIYTPTPFKNYKIENKKECIVLNKTDTNTKQIISPELQKQFLNANITNSIVIKKSTTAPIKINAMFNEQNNSLVDILNIELQNNVKAQIIITYKGLPAYHNGLIKINMGKNSVLDIIVYSNFLGNNYLTIQDTKQQNAKINYCIIDFAQQNTIQNLYSTSLGENTKTQLDTMYFGKENAVVDLNYNVELTKPKNIACLNTIGALSENARKHYKGLINFIKGAKKSEGSENEYCIMLSKTAKSKSLPMLLCGEEDVTGSHSASAGKVDESALFYIMNRGINKTEATKILVGAQFNSITKNIFNEDVKNEILENIDRSINFEN